jgi:hypothetical protein
MDGPAMSLGGGAGDSSSMKEKAWLALMQWGRLEEKTGLEHLQGHWNLCGDWKDI